MKVVLSYEHSVNKPLYFVGEYEESTGKPIWASNKQRAHIFDDVDDLEFQDNLIDFVENGFLPLRIERAE